MSQKILIIANTHSGTFKKHPDLSSHLQFLVEEAQKKDFSCTLISLSENNSVEALIEKAARDDCSIIVMAGGDGTINTALNALISHKLSLGILPVGTFNHLAKDLHIPLDLDSAFEAIIAGHTTEIDVAKVNEHYFINNSSIGLYPNLVDERKVLENAGFNKIISSLRAFIIILKKHPLYTVSFSKNASSDNQTEETSLSKVPFIFIGNNHYDLDSSRIGKRMSLTGGILGIYISHALTRMTSIKLALSSFLGKIRVQKEFDTLGLHMLTINTSQKQVLVSVDGEITKMKPPLAYTIHPKILKIIVPQKTTF